jgi:hypothetical protein
VTSGPSPEGIAALQFAAAVLKPYEPPKRRRRWPRWLTAKRLALILVADLVLGSIGWHYLTKPHPGAVTAALQRTAADASHNRWDAVYRELCRNDQAQLSETDLATAGRAALLQLGELRGVTVTSVHNVNQSLGPLDIPNAAQVSGRLVPVIGQPSAFTITLVRELGGWHVCLSAGGYSSAAMGVSQPLGGGFTP